MYKISYFNEEVNGTESSPLVRFPWIEHFEKCKQSFTVRYLVVKILNCISMMFN
jgi:hypothetical protein